MTSEAKTLEEYITQLPEEQKEIIRKLRATIKKNLSKGFKEGLNYILNINGGNSNNKE